MFHHLRLDLSSQKPRKRLDFAAHTTTREMHTVDNKRIFILIF